MKFWVKILQTYTAQCIILLAYKMYLFIHAGLIINLFTSWNIHQCFFQGEIKIIMKQIILQSPKSKCYIWTFARNNDPKKYIYRNVKIGQKHESMKITFNFHSTSLL